MDELLPALIQFGSHVERREDLMIAPEWSEGHQISDASERSRHWHDEEQMRVGVKK